jgi:ABC-type uncharacterized transport system substrate-binding protein
MAQGQRHRVFILHSYEKDHVCGQPQAEGVIVALKDAGFDDKNMDIQSFYMNTKRKPEFIEQQAGIALKTIREFKPDVLVTFDDNAFRTVALQLVDTSIGIVFSGMNGQPENYNKTKRFLECRKKPGHNVTGVYEFLYLVDAIRIHSVIFPGLIETRIIIEMDSPTGKAVYNQIKLELKDLPKEKWSIRVVGNLEEYKAELKAANADSSVGAIYPVALLLRDKQGKIHTAPEIFKLTTLISKKPELVVNYAFCKMGLFGGAAVDFVAMGKQAGVKVASILNGTNPGSIPIENAENYALAFNLDRARQLKIKIPEEILAAADDIFF